MGTGMLVRKIRFNSIGQVFSVFFVKNLPFDSAKNCRLFVDGDFEKHVLKVEYGTFDALIQREEQIARNFLRFYPFYDEAIAAIRRNETLSTEEKDRIAGIIQPLIDFQHGQAAAKGIPLPDNLFQQ